MRWHSVNMRPALAACVLLVVVLMRASADVSHLQSSSVAGGATGQYSITPSSQLAYYHYPAPKGAALNEYPQATVQYQQQQQQQHQHQQSHYTQHQQLQPQPQQSHVSSMYSTAPQTRYAAASTAQQAHYQHQQQQQHQQQSHQQPQFQPIANPYATYQQRSSTAAAHAHQQQAQSPLVRQFTAPALENAAFTSALRSQGYNSAAATHAAPSSSSTSSSSAAAAAAASSASASLVAPSSSSSSSSASASGGGNYQLRSLNIKLPVPIGIMPINIAPLPLQAGTPYSSLRGVTSYGTLYPQRK